MPKFIYDSYSSEGARTSGEIHASTSAIALDLLAQRGLTPTALSQGDRTPWWSREFSLSGSEAAPLQELERFFSSLATMLSAQFPLPKALEFAQHQVEHRGLSRAVGQLGRAIKDGQPLADALEDTGDAFPARYRSLLALGAASNTLAETVEAAAGQLGFEARLKREVRAALIYPVLLLLMALVVLAILVFYLAPTLVPVFSSAEASVPTVLWALDWLGSFLREYWTFTLLAGAIAVLGVWMMLRRAKVSVASLLLKFPVFGAYIRKRETLRGLQGLRLMLQSGAHLTAGLSAAAQAVAVPAFATHFEEARMRIEAGETLAGTLGQSDLLDGMGTSMIIAGDEGDNLAQTLDSAIATLSNETTTALSSAVRLLTPLLTLLIGGLVTAVMLTTVSAIMDLNDAVF